MTLEQFKKKMSNIPDTPGVYFFLDKQKKLLYIGKATSLRSRLRSYFSPDLHTTRGPLITSMVEKAATIDWRETDSVLEALILEANLIRTHKPKHNTDLKDDKSWNYVVITKEDFPRVLLVRGKDLEQFKRTSREAPQRDDARTERFSSKKIAYSREVAFELRNPKDSFASPLHVFGPFPHGMQLKDALKIVRKIFTYRDTCVPCQSSGTTPSSTLQAKRGRVTEGTVPSPCKPCFNRQVGLCPGVCSGEISKTEYKKIMRHITLFFRGKKKELLASLEREMKKSAKEERFEDAARLRGQVFALNHIQDVSLIKEEYRAPAGGTSVRIEAYDVAHLHGDSTVGVMVVVEDGVAQKNEYRKFRIRTAKAGDDVGALKEILSRRLGHDEWPMPRMIIVDGGTGQIHAAEALLRQYGIGIPVVGVVKDEKHRPREIRGFRELTKIATVPTQVTERDILLANAEAHRYAIGYHRNLSRRPFKGG